MKALMLTWMFQNALLGGGLLMVGCLLAARCRSPVRRLRLFEWTLAAALIAPLVAATQWPWQLPLRCLPAPRPIPVRTDTMASAPLQATSVSTNPALAGPPVLAGSERENPGVRATEPALRDTRSEAWSWPDWRDVILAIQALAVALLAAKWLASALAIAWLSYSAKPIDARLVARIGEQLPARLRPSATIRLDPNVSTPCAFGLFRPCILLPEFLTQADRAQQMIFALAHEASHLLRGDLWSWRLVRVAQFGLWFQPAYWWLRRQTRLCQDYLADQDATLVGKPADLADFLVQLARMQQSAQNVAAMAMRPPRTDLSRRINMLLHPHSELECRCPRRFQAFLALTVFSILGMAAVLRLEAQEQATESKTKGREGLPSPYSLPNPGSLTQVRGRVLGPNGKPVGGAKLYLGAVSLTNTGKRLLRDGRFYRQEMKSAVRTTSDSDGHFGFTFSGAELRALDSGDLTGLETRGVIGEVMAVAPGHGCGWAEIDNVASELTLHLVDDIPIEGRILDSDGHPVAGATLRTVGIGAAPPEDLSVLFKPLSPRDAFYFASLWSGSLPGQPANITTGRDGCFRLTGIGRDRLVQFRVEGPRIASTLFWVMTRTGEPVIWRNAWSSVFSASFDFVGEPSRLITGTVRNKETGKPMAGVSVGRDRTTTVKGVTDENGRYELRGLAKAPSYLLVAAPRDGLSFERQITLEDTPGLDTLRCDCELVSGVITVRGRVTEKETGKPIAGAHVDYHPVNGNSYASKLLPGSWSPRSETTALADGSYRLTVMPGPGVIGVIAPHRASYAPAVATMEERKRFFKTPAVFGSAPISQDDNIVALAANFFPVWVETYNVLVLIEPGEDERAIVRDVALESPRQLKGRIVGPDDQPLAGTTVYGLVRFGVEKLKGNEFTVRGVNPKAKRSLGFYHQEKQLGYYLKDLGLMSASPLTIKLQPCGSASGRIVDEHGAPVGQVVVDVDGNMANGANGQQVVTDSKGCFHVAGLVARLPYVVMEGPDRDTPRFFAYVTVEAGQHKNMGDIKMKESMK